MTQPFGWPVRIPAPFFEPADITLPRQSMPQREVARVRPDTDRAGARRGCPRDRRRRRQQAGRRRRGRGDLDRCGGAAQVGAGADRPDRHVHAPRRRSPRRSDLTAWDGFASTPEVTVRAEAAVNRPITLTISPKNTTPVGGRVVDPAGQPIAGASVRIWRQVRDKAGAAIVVEPIAAGDGSVALHTDADGRYRTRRRFPAHAAYYAEAFAPGRLTARSPAIALAEQFTKTSVLVLRRVGTVEGPGRRPSGQPIAGAAVRQSGDGPLPTETLSTQDGRFRLPGVLEGPALVFAEKEGFRTHFRPVHDGTQPVQVVLARTNEPPTIAYHTLPPALPVEEEIVLARRLIQPYVETFLQCGTELEKLPPLQDTAEIDPLDMLERLESFKFVNPDYLTVARVNLAEALSRENLDEATDLLEASGTADIRAWGYVGICELRRDLPPARLRELLAQAAVNERGMKSSTDRLQIEAQLADRWLDLGETERARAVIDEALAIGQNTPKGNKNGYNLGLVAEALARLDLPAALKLLDDLGATPQERQERPQYSSSSGPRRHRLQAGGSIAGRRRTRAGADPDQRDRGSVRRRGLLQDGCEGPGPRPPHRRTPPLARRRLAYRPHTLGLMARAIAATDKTAALAPDRRSLCGPRPGSAPAGNGHLPRASTRWRRACCRSSRRSSRTGWPSTWPAPWRCGRPGATRPVAKGTSTRTTTPALAMLVARYDRALAARLLEPELQKIGSHATAFGTDLVTWRILAALALIDPKRAVEQVEALPEDPAPGTDPMANKYQVADLRRQGAGPPRRRPLAVYLRILPLSLDPRSAVFVRVDGPPPRDRSQR